MTPNSNGMRAASKPSMVQMAVRLSQYAIRTWPEPCYTMSTSGLPRC